MDEMQNMRAHEEEPSFDDDSFDDELDALDLD